MHALVIDGVGRGAGRPCEPVHADVGEYLVPRDRVLGQRVAGVGPLLELLDDPCQLPGRGVGQRVGQRLRAGGLDLEVAVALGQEVLQPLHPLLLRRAEGRQVLLGDVPERDEAHGGRVDVDADHMLGVDPAEVGCDKGAVVAALGAVALVAEPAHQLGERTRDPPTGPSGLGDRAGEPEPGQRGDDQVERGGICCAVSTRIAERADDVQEFHERARPAVEQEQRRGVRLGRLHVQEVDLLAVDSGRVLRV